MDIKAMSRRRVLGGLAVAGWMGFRPPAVAAPGQSPQSAESAPRDALLKSAVAALDAFRISTRTNMAVVDFSLHSRLPRLHIVALDTGAVTNLLCAHGRGSDKDHDGFAEVFSNQEGSAASSLGAYRVLGQGVGPLHGPNLVLEGLEPTNDNARQRAIIVHSAWYAEPDVVAKAGKMGRSNGCFVTSDADRDTVFAALAPGSLLFAGV